MDRIPNSRLKQNGAIAIMVGVSLVVLIGMLALVIDLGHTYLVKAGLQNAADAAALAGAKELNGTAAGVAAARNKAIEMARHNTSAFAIPVGSGDSDGGLDIYVGNCPDDGSCVMEPAASVTSDLQAADKTFLQVDTRQRGVTTWFAGVFGQGVSQLQTYGMAVAGKYAIDVSPLAICGLPNDASNPNVTELGYERGVTYRISDANPLGPGTMYWVDPVATTAGACSGSTNATLPYMCTGKMAYTPVVGGLVYTNTGISDPQLEALDSRFDVFNNKNKCDPATAPPDRNIKEFSCSNSKGTDGCVKNASGNGLPRDWMNPDPARQSIAFTEIGGVNQPKPWSTRSFGDYGVLWSGSRPSVAAGDASDSAVSSRWSSMYHAAGGAATSYPQTSPYAQTSGNFFQAPAHQALSGRRMLNLSIIDCSAAGGVCRPMRVLGIGKFLMQRRSNVEDKEIYVEFAGLLPTPLPTSDIRLYR
jgi:Flp pilus assembly protein TadG